MSGYGAVIARSGDGKLPQRPAPVGLCCREGRQFAGVGETRALPGVRGSDRLHAHLGPEPLRRLVQTLQDVQRPNVERADVGEPCPRGAVESGDEAQQLPLLLEGGRVCGG